jgi:hypothetical protein
MSFTPDEIFAAFWVGFIVGMVVTSFIRDAWEEPKRYPDFTSHYRRRIDSLEAEVKRHAERIHNQRAEIHRLKSVREETSAKDAPNPDRGANHG